MKLALPVAFLSLFASIALSSPTPEPILSPEEAARLLNPRSCCGELPYTCCIVGSCCG
ncbi:hypothetical protein BT69DRAFT_1275316, partial [Atractiella rhizophila]